MENINLKLLAGAAQNSEITNPVLGPALQGLSQSEGGVAFFQKLLPAAITLCLVVGVIIFFFMLIMGAIQWISSGGDKQGLESAKGKLTNALIGIVILFSVFAVAKLIETFFGISILTLDIGSLIIK